MILLQAEGISRRVSADRWLFRDLNIALAAGEQLALQGASAKNCELWHLQLWL